MFERIQSDSFAAKAPAADASSRADLAVAPPPAAAELPERAITPAAQGQGVTTEQDPNASTLRLVGAMRREMGKAARADEDRKKLDDIEKKLFRAREAKAKSDVSGEIVTDADKALEDLTRVEIALPGAEAAGDLATGAAKSAAEFAIDAHRERTLDKIDGALRKVGVLREKLTARKADAHDRLVDIVSSVNGLNIARSQVDGTEFSIQSASTAVDSIMVNLRSAVVAHGKLSPDIVRLILS